jgi:hypothetical protein
VEQRLDGDDSRVTFVFFLKSEEEVLPLPRVFSFFFSNCFKKESLSLSPFFSLSRD